MHPLVVKLSLNKQLLLWLPIAAIAVVLIVVAFALGVGAGFCSIILLVGAPINLIMTAKAKPVIVADQGGISLRRAAPISSPAGLAWGAVTNMYVEARPLLGPRLVVESSPARYTTALRYTDANPDTLLAALLQVRAGGAAPPPYAAR